MLPLPVTTFARREDRRTPLEPAEIPVGEVEELALHGDARDRLGDAADRADDVAAPPLEGLVGRARATVHHLGAAEAQAHQLAVLDDQVVGHAQRLELEAVLVLRLGQHLLATRTHLVGATLVGAVRHLHQRHVLFAAPVEESRPLEAQLLELDAMARQDLRDALHLELDEVDLDAALGQLRPRQLEHQRLHHVDRSEAAAHHEGAVLRLEDRALVAGLFAVVEPDDEGVLVDEPLADVVVGAFDRQRAVAPGAAGEHHAREAPLVHQRVEVDRRGRCACWARSARPHA